jgi:hypothetical protein
VFRGAIPHYRGYRRVLNRSSIKLYSAQTLRSLRVLLEFISRSPFPGGAIIALNQKQRQPYIHDAKEARNGVRSAG